jgi:hypothetical protein
LKDVFSPSPLPQPYGLLWGRACLLGMLVWVSVLFFSVGLEQKKDLIEKILWWAE